MDQPTRRQIKGFNLRLKLLIGFVALFSIVFAGAFVWFYHFSTDRALERIKADMLDTLSGLAENLEPYVDELLALAADGVPNADGFSDDPRYVHQMDILAAVHRIEPRAWPYTYIRGEGQNGLIALTDLWARYDAGRAFGFQQVWTSIGPAYSGLTTETAYEENGALVLYNDDWGEWVSVYRPLYDENGAAVAAVGLDFEAAYVRQVQAALNNSIVLAFGITYALLLVMVLLIARTLTQPIMRLTTAAEHIGEGNYDQDLTPLTRVRFPDEISRLAEVFTIMTGKVSQRETHLREQVAQLRIEIDETRKTRQVDEIVDTEYFRDLQQKAQAFRRRTQDKDEAADDGGDAGGETEA
ncbi:MAG: HAMP domain-containing protein [Anaerolineae bacterium]|nr:HAMP domain-containing protein [Anaerolineae bacterium]